MVWSTIVGYVIIYTQVCLNLVAQFFLAGSVMQTCIGFSRIVCATIETTDNPSFDIKINICLSELHE